MPPTATSNLLSDSQLWQQVLAGDTQAFEQVVVRHQSAVSAVAYSILGDFNLCQDVAQESFWQAYRNRAQLRETERLASWLCGIARNLAHQAIKSKPHSTDPLLMDAHEGTSDDDDPVLKSITKEESLLVWNALENIPQAYREALVLFYRQGHSVQDVAETLDISIDAAKQRLSRGREMMRGQLTLTVEGVLQRSRPSSVFTAKVMAGIAAWTTSFKVVEGLASAAGAAGGLTTSAAKSLAVGSASIGLWGGLLGAGGGGLGAFLGTWLPAQLAPTMTERELLRKTGRASLCMSVLYTLILLAVTPLLSFKQGWIYYFLSIALATLVFLAWMIRSSLVVNRQVQQIRKSHNPESDPNDSPVKRFADNHLAMKRWRGRHFTSSWRFANIPLIDIHFSDPQATADTPKPEQAFGWIAMGDRATGILLAFGGIAKGLIAIGGCAIGIIAIGGCSFGALAIGGGAVGGLAIGGGALGMLGIGGLSIGYDAIGGGAIGWNSAVGGGAIAYHIAAGGGALAHDFAIGGAASAAQANTDMARQQAAEHSFIWTLKYYQQHMAYFIAGIVTLSVLPILFIPVAYTCKPLEENS